MKLLEAAGLATLREQGQQRKFRAAMKPALKIALEIWAEAKERGITNALGGCQTAEAWQRKWLSSKQFHLIKLPLNAAALTCHPRTENLVLKKIHAREETPIVVDYNRNQVGRTLQGFTPQVIVIDGKHRFQAATLRGETHIMAWVGQEAMEIVPSLHAFGGAGMGGGGGPKSMSPAGGAKLVAQSQQEAHLSSRSGTFAEGLKKKTLNVDSTEVDAGGPGSGRHKGTGMTDEEFTNFARKVGMARNANRDEEDRLRNAGQHEQANKIYESNRATVGKMLQDSNVHPKAFDDHMKQISKGSGRRVNVKMQNSFPNWDSGDRG